MISLNNLKMGTFFTSPQVSYIPIQFMHCLNLGCDVGNNWFNSMQQSGIDLESTALKQLHDEGRVRCFTAGHLLDVFHVAEYLQASMKANDKVLLLLEGISPLLQAQKVLRANAFIRGLGVKCTLLFFFFFQTMLGTLNKPSLVESTLDSLSLLTKFHAVACFWVNSGVFHSFLVHQLHINWHLSILSTVSRSSQAYSLREAHPKDPLGVLWRRKVPRVLYYQPANHTVPQSD